jgi:two-component system capsular synthesis sensor histidine kinase RcsC
MRLKNYLHQISPILSSPHGASPVAHFCLVLLLGILGGVYSFLLFTFNSEISQRRSYMSSAIAGSAYFFTTREALLESLSLSATRMAHRSAGLRGRDPSVTRQTPGRNGASG